MQVFEIFIPLLGMTLTFFLIGFIVFLFNRSGRERRLRQIEFQEKMLEKFVSSQEFMGFLQTAEGQRYLRSLAQEPRRDPKEKIIRSVRTGVVLMVLAAGLIALSFLFGFQNPMEEPPFVIGFLALFLGAGFLASAGISYWMSKAWGLFPEEPKPLDTNRT